MSSTKKSGKKGAQKTEKKATLTPQDEALQSILKFIQDTLYPLFSNEQVLKIIPRDEDMDKREQMELAIQAASATFVRSVSLCTQFIITVPQILISLHYSQYFCFYFFLLFVVTVGFRGPPENPEECVPGAKMVENSLGKLSEVVINAMGLVATPLRSQLADLMTGTLTALANVFYLFFKNF